MKIRLLDSAKDDLKTAFRFYEKQQAGLGKYFLSSLQADIDSLRFFAGIHPLYADKFYRLLSRRFPHTVYYQVENELVSIYAVLDCRRSPENNQKRLK